MSLLIKNAKIFATAAHAAVGQTRKYTGEPYIVHPIEVASIVASVGGTEEMIAAALLHDVVEDTKVTNELITTMFGNDVGELVKWLTDVSRPVHGNRAFRKQMDREHIMHAPPAAKTIKLADLISNGTSIVQYDPNFAVTYLREKQLLLEVLKEGNPILWQEAFKITV